MIKYMIENDIRYDKQRLGKLIEKRKIASTWHSKEWLHVSYDSNSLFRYLIVTPYDEIENTFVILKDEFIYV